MSRGGQARDVSGRSIAAILPQLAASRIPQPENSRKRIDICAISVSSADLALVQSIFSLRGEDFRWTDDPDKANWWIVDAEEERDARLIARSAEKIVLALVSDYSSLPSPGWTMIAKPPRGKQLIKVIEHFLDRTRTSDQLPRWSLSELKLKRWPNITRYQVTPALIYWCSQMLTRHVPYSQLLAALPAESVARVLADAFDAGYLDMRDVRPFQSDSGDSHEKRPPIWRRFWSRWGGA